MYCVIIFFFFNDTATTEIYTLSLHDALPIYVYSPALTFTLIFDTPPSLTTGPTSLTPAPSTAMLWSTEEDRKSTRLNSSHANISYAVFCLKKKKIAHKA